VIIGGILHVSAVPKPFLPPYQAFALGIGEANQINNAGGVGQIKMHG